MPYLEKQATEMNTKLVETQQSNTELLSTVTAQRAEIEALVRGLENVIQDLDASAQIMAQDDVQDLSGETRDLEMEMRTWGWRRRSDFKTLSTFPFRIRRNPSRPHPECATSWIISYRVPAPDSNTLLPT
jgi:hypothetical protein